MAALLKNKKKITRLCRVSGSYDLYRHIFRQSRLEVYMGMGKTGIPWVPWDSHRNGNKISHEMGMGWEWELSAWEWELTRGVGTVFCE